MDHDYANEEAYISQYFDKEWNKTPAQKKQELEEWRKEHGVKPKDDE